MREARRETEEEEEGALGWEEAGQGGHDEDPEEEEAPRGGTVEDPRQNPHRGATLQPRAQGHCKTVRPPHSDLDAGPQMLVDRTRGPAEHCPASFFKMSTS